MISTTKAFIKQGCSATLFVSSDDLCEWSDGTGAGKSEDEKKIVRNQGLSEGYEVQ
jgi:hypothetical protein